MKGGFINGKYLSSNNPLQHVISNHRGSTNEVFYQQNKNELL